MQLKEKQLGVSLIESLVALLVISVGLLGIAALQITAMSQNASALNHSQAVWIAYNIADRIRANADAFDNYLDANIDTDKAYSADCTNGCTKEAMVLADAADWKSMMAALPAGRGKITQIGDELVVSVMWDDDGDGGNVNTDCTDPKPDDLDCYTMTLAKPVVPD